jgi:hypothetical protein
VNMMPKSATRAPGAVTPEAVKQLIHDTWPNLTPHPATCSDIARMICDVRGARAPKQKKVPILGTAEKHGRLFLRHLEGSRKRLKGLGHRPNVDAIMAEMDMAAQHVRAVIEGCNSIEGDGYMDLAPVVADSVRRALRLSTVDVPRSVNAQDPLCLFVVGVFRLIGIDLSEFTVSDMLRGRYHRPRSGKRKIPLTVNEVGANRSKSCP